MPATDAVAQLRDAAPSGPFDDHAAVLHGLVRSDAALVTLVDEQQQTFIGRAGALAVRATPIDASLCARTAALDTTVVLPDVTAVPELADHPAACELGVRAYLGAPLRLADGRAVGAVCVASSAPRQWSTQDVEAVTTMATVAAGRLALWVLGEQARLHAEELELVHAVLAHEVGGQLGIVVSGIETARRPDLDERARDRLLAVAERNARRTSDTLRALLHTDQRVVMAPRTVVLQDALEELTPRESAGHLRVDCAGVRLVTDPVLLRRVVGNLVDNALRHGGPDVHVVVTGTQEPDGGVTVVVADDGPGVASEALPALFEPYARATGAPGGYGLGLFIVRRLVERLGGSVVVSVEDGTRFTLTLPSGGPPADDPAPS